MSCALLLLLLLLLLFVVVLVVVFPPFFFHAIVVVVIAIRRNFRMLRRVVSRCRLVYDIGAVRNFASKYTRRLGRKQMKNMSPKRGNKNFHKGKGVPSEGRLTSKGCLLGTLFCSALFNMYLVCQVFSRLIGKKGYICMSPI